MAGILGYLSILADDIGSLATKTVSTATKSLATSLDDVSLLFDDIATYTKLASVKSSGLVVDDLAAIASFTNETTSDILKKELHDAKNADEFKQNVQKLPKDEQEKILKELENIRQIAINEAHRKAALRELPIVYKIALGSLKNKFIIIPIVLLMSFIAPWLIAPTLIVGGIYLAFEGVESILEKLGHHHEDEEKKDENKNLSTEKLEELKIKSAIKTDFILSFEIIVITLSLVENSDFITKLSVLVLIGIIATVFVYGIVGFIIKLDDIGFYLQEKKSQISKNIGTLFVKVMPKLIKTIGILGTIAMLAVGGGIIAHETHILHSIESYLSNFGTIGSLANFLSEIILGGIIGFLAVKLHPLFSKVLNIFTKQKM